MFLLKNTAAVFYIFTKILQFFILFQSIDWDSIKWDELSPEQKWKLEHMRLHEKHRGHEKMHTEMILILFATLVISQVALVKWREIYPGTYHVRQLFTIFGQNLVFLVCFFCHFGYWPLWAIFGPGPWSKKWGKKSSKFDFLSM